ncbi:unnamed protein product [Sphagnum troendelagicum]|uniref:Uncharacterized protein n=1 Tax=Sphagnum troendelagicum TaxID=128251 RepID=A0ABP0T8W2_9BRYO
MHVRLLSMLDKYNYLRQEKDEEKRRLRGERSRPTAALNYVALNKDEMAGLASTVAKGSAGTSPLAASVPSCHVCNTTVNLCGRFRKPITSKQQ